MRSFVNSRRLLCVAKGYWLLIASILVLAFMLFAAEGRADWKSAWDTTVRAAKEEGPVVIYPGTGYSGVLAKFQKEFPDIKVTEILGRSNQHVSRILSERRVGKFLGDVFIGPVTLTYGTMIKAKVFEPIKPALILPEVLDQSKWLDGQLTYLDDERDKVIVFNGQTQIYYSYNTNLVNPNEFKSYWDLLNPKWKGKMVMVHPTYGTGPAKALRFLYYSPELGPTFLKRLLSEMEPTASRDDRQLVNWLAVGRYSIGLFTFPRRTGLDIAKEQGLPVDWFGPTRFKEGTTLGSGSGNVGILNKAPHPNAARVFVNWLLSREGQKAFQRIVGGDSLRTDIPKDQVPPDIRRTEGVKYLNTDVPEWIDMTPIYKLVNKAWAQRR